MACADGERERALELLEEMSRKGVVPDATTFKSALVACGEESFGEVESLLGLSGGWDNGGDGGGDGPL